MQVTKQNPDRLLMMSILTLLACFALWWSLINQSNRALANSRPEIAELSANIEQAKRWLNREPAWTTNYARALAELAAKEKDMLPEGQEMSFLSAAIERVRTNHPAVRFVNISPATLKERVELMPQFIDPASANLPAEWIVQGRRVAMLPEFPYRRNASIAYKCQGTYHDFVAFLADLEKTYPYMQFQLLSMTKPEQQVEGEDHWRFELKVVALLRPPLPQ